VPLPPHVARRATPLLWNASPGYDFKIHRRETEPRRVDPAPVVIVEGILIFVDARVREQLDMHVQFVEPSKRWADLIIPEGGNNRVALDLIIAKLKTVLSG
jgi:uridine kinase